ncbi:NlpC/P60 family protein [Providencia hangzhouensis]
MERRSLSSWRTTNKGVDCSSFVQRTFLEQFGVELPRTTLRIESSGKSVKRNNEKSARDIVSL